MAVVPLQNEGLSKGFFISHQKLNLKEEVTVFYSKQL